MLALKNIPRILLMIALVWSLDKKTLCAQATISRYGWEFKPKQKKVVVPFELHNNLIVIKMRVNKSDTLHFILDTGASTNILTDPDVAPSLGLYYVRKLAFPGYEGDTLAAWVSVNNEFNMPGIVARGQHLMAMQKDVLDISSYVGMPVHGVLGHDLFQNFVVKINYKANCITLYDPKRYKSRKNSGIRFPITVKSGKPYVETMVKLDNDSVYSSKLLIDIGAGSGLTLEKAGNRFFEIPKRNNYKHLGNGFGGRIWGFEGRIKELRLGKYVMKEVVAAFPDSNKVRGEMVQATGRQGSMGCEVLKRFDIVLNYKEGYMLLKPTRKAFIKPFERDMSGLTFRTKDKNFHSFFVEAVESGSPAHQAGLRVGDELFVLNKKMAYDLKLEDIQSQLNFKEGKSIKLVMKRGDSYYSTSFLLKRTI